MGPSTVIRLSISLDRGHLTTTLPASAKPLSVGLGPNAKSRAVDLWVQVPVDPETNKMIEGLRVERTFEVHGTGHRIRAKRDFIGTVIDRAFVWHVFEVRPPR